MMTLPPPPQVPEAVFCVQFAADLCWRYNSPRPKHKSVKYQINIVYMHHSRRERQSRPSLADTAILRHFATRQKALKMRTTCIFLFNVLLFFQ